MEWRVGRGWTPAELAARLGKLATLERNFTPSATMTPEEGWNQVMSQSQLGTEAPGPEVEAGPFTDLVHALSTFLYSDPRIVEVHSPEGPLEGRRMLLELKSVGLHILVPILVAQVRNELTAKERLFGLCFDTLHGHVEAGREWFLLRKDLASGELRFSIRAAWRLGQFPNAWTKLGFRMLGKRYQRAWHHLAHVRLREHLHSSSAGVESSKTPVQFWATRARRVQGAAGLEKERELDAIENFVVGDADGRGGGDEERSTPRTARTGKGEAEEDFALADRLGGTRPP